MIVGPPPPSFRSGVRSFLSHGYREKNRESLGGRGRRGGGLWCGRRSRSVAVPPPIFHLAKGKEEEKKERGNADEEIRRNLKSLLLLFSILEVRERGGGDPIGGAECMGGD